MKIYIGADHRGVDFKAKILGVLKKHHYAFIDEGTHDPEKSCDYPKIAYQVATQVAKSKNDRGILVCMSGIGQAIAANKVKGAYAALCCNEEAARLSREHNNANVLVLSAKFIDSQKLESMMVTWLTTAFEGGRHRRRFNQIKKIEKGLKLK